MMNVTETAEAIVDIWPFINELNKEQVVPDYVCQKQLVETVYRNSENTFEHVLLPTDQHDYFIVIIVNLAHRVIEGHYKLDLKQEYKID